MDKLGSRSDRCLFVGYPKESKGYYFYLPEEQKLFVSLRAIFLENEFLGEETGAAKVELSEVQQVEEPAHFSDNIEPDLIRSNLEPIEVSIRRSIGYRINQIDTTISWSGTAIPLNSMRTMRIRSLIWMQCRGQTLRNG